MTRRAISAYQYPALSKALEMSPQEIIGAMEKAGIVGLGGAGFPTAAKWRGVAEAPGEEKHAIMNADEGEPGAFKDRRILENAPYLAIEGLLIAMRATGAGQGHVYIRKEYSKASRIVKAQLAKLPSHAAQYGAQVSIFRAPGGYICGEESALIESIHGPRAEPGVRPPFPAQRGLHGKPTLVNNVETLVMAALALEKGPEWFRGNWAKLVSVSGDVKKPGVYSVSQGATLRDVIFTMAGGMAGPGFKFALVGGYSGKVAVEEELDSIRMQNPASFGAGAVIVMNTQRPAPWAAANIARFFRDESCGKCVPCREGTVVLDQALSPGRRGKKVMNLDELKPLCAVMKEACLCGLGRTAPRAIEGLLAWFAGEFEVAP
ncbi:MAG: SLBB domain-containing protein [Nitrospinota bacterium]|nr:SLBB domain-containing protein [Nitrospinota bacterium]